MQRILLNQMLEMIDEPNRTGFLRLYSENKDIIKVARGSKSKHQAWTGGYLDHLEEMATMAVDLFHLFTQTWERKVPFTLSDVMTVIAVHDLEKPWKHKLHEMSGKWISDPALASHEGATAFIADLLAKYNIVLTDAQQQALEFVHGENEKYDPDKNLTNKLGAFCHTLDYLSARLFHNYPKNPRT